MEIILKTLIIKIGATGDVLRTTPLLRVLSGDIYWLTADNNNCLLQRIHFIKSSVSWSSRLKLRDHRFDLVINLEDTFEVADFVRKEIYFKKLIGAFINQNNQMTYSYDLSNWFDLSLISQHGKEKADVLKFLNRKSYQELLFEGLGYHFNNEKYIIAKYAISNLHGDIAIAPKAGNVWPNKNWAFFPELKNKFEKEGYTVNYLPYRSSIYEHFGDIRNHRYIICGDSLPMHIALGFGIKCLSIFICTSPWEIYDYGLLKKVVSPQLERYFYKRSYNEDATTSIDVDLVYNEVINHINI